jgi:cyclic beta-1,2-glucan synthetase
VREIREDLPFGYYAELPKLPHGDLAGYPRIYSIALELVAHTDSRLDADTLRRFLIAYQQTTPLMIGELWAVAITLRIVLVENLRRLASLIINSRRERDGADALAEELIALAVEDPLELPNFIKKHLEERKDPTDAFIVQLTRQLREQDPVIAQACDVIEQRQLKNGTNTAQIVQLELQRQAATQVTVGNIITSMRLLSTLDWEEFFESVTLVDPILKEDPAGAYAKMNFATRNRYRGVIERISNGSIASELDIALRTGELAGSAKASDPNDCENS